MSRHATEETLHDQVKNLQETIDTLIHSLCWERRQWLILAAEITAREGLEEAIASVRHRCLMLMEQVSI